MLKIFWNIKERIKNILGNFGKVEASFQRDNGHPENVINIENPKHVELQFNMPLRSNRNLFSIFK